MKKKYIRPSGTKTLLDFCLEMHEIFMDQQNDPNPMRKYVPLEQLAADFETTTRTIKRYLAYMRNSLNLPVAHVKERGGQGYTRKVVSFPTEMFSEGQFLLFVIAQKALESGSPFGAQLKPICQQLEASLQGRTTGNLKEYASIVSFHTYGLDAPAIPDPVIFDLLFKAALERREVVLTHRKAALGAKPTERRVRPIRMRMIGRAWYLWNADVVTGEIKKFGLTRIRNVRPTDVHFDPIPLDLEGQFQYSLGAFTSKSAVHVELHITGDAAELVQERKVHPTQKITRHKDGSVTLELDVAQTIDLENWILTLRAEVEVIAPETLREAIHRIHTLAAKRNAPKLG